MKKFLSVSTLFLLAFAFSTAASAQPYSSADGDFFTKFWKEKYLGGDDGHPGNILMAVGEGFIFQNAVLDSVVIGGVESPCGGGFLPAYVTTYEGGKLTLNKKGPWADAIKVSGITATNFSGYDAGMKFFVLEFAGMSANDVVVDVTATWCETGDNYVRQETKKGKPVFQLGFGFDAVIDISYP